MDCIPEDIINEVINRFRNAYAIYVYGGSLDCSGGDVDIAVFMEEIPREVPRIGDNVDLQVFRKPRNSLFFVYIIKTGRLVYGNSLDIDVDSAIKNELEMIDEREFLFLNSDDEATVCKSLKELLFLLAALKCGIYGSSNWYRMVKCLGDLGINAPSEFKHCLNPPSIDVLRQVGEPILRRVIWELRSIKQRSL
ncbi:nucleotidyltransferase domain-containing protein [Vulcanisaeta moutnovskia]|uniref:nucleotidyltransferase domain-containing protein n=1 Tax=Vulcanisaeta moutnovskia TaxID=985052 RepID=UPI001ED97FE0|nr:nucleotidyltransferase domain-containing protein [Vulcanisaeta moutnovskia]